MKEIDKVGGILDTISQRFKEAPTEDKKRIQNAVGVIQQVIDHQLYLKDLQPGVRRSLLEAFYGFYENGWLPNNDSIPELKDVLIEFSETLEEKYLPVLIINSDKYKEYESLRIRMEELNHEIELLETQKQTGSQDVVVLNATDQFEVAQENYSWQLKAWAALSLASIVVLVGLLLYFNRQVPDKESIAQVVYLAGLRITALGALGSVAVYCFGVLKTQLFLSQRNRHRLTLVKSAKSLADSVEEGQKSFVYERIMGTIIEFDDMASLRGKGGGGGGGMGARADELVERIRGVSVE